MSAVTTGEGSASVTFGDGSGLALIAGPCVIESEEHALAMARAIREIAREESVAVYPDEPLRVVVYRMAEKGITRMPVVERETQEFLGLVSLDDLLKARARHLEEERRRERTLRLRFLLPGRTHRNKRVN